MTPDARFLLPGEREIIHAPHHPYLEGPKLHKFNGWYYTLAPGGSVQVGWQVVYRSRDIFGPYEEKVVLEQGSTAINGPHQGALVDIPSNNEQVPGAESAWWFLHFQDQKAYGRIMHMNPVRWVEGWPMMGVDYDGNGIGEPVPEWEKPVTGGVEPVCAPATTDEFDSPALGLQWQWHANHQPDWYSLGDRPGWLTLRALPTGNDSEGKSLPSFKAPHLLAQKFPAREFSVETLLDASLLGEGATAGLVIVGGGHSALLESVDSRGSGSSFTFSTRRSRRSLHGMIPWPFFLFPSGLMPAVRFHARIPEASHGKRNPICRWGGGLARCQGWAVGHGGFGIGSLRLLQIPLTAPTVSPAHGSPTARMNDTLQPMRLGVRAHDFGRLPAGELASPVAAHGFTSVQLALNKAIAGLDLKPGDLNPGLAFEIGQAFRRCGIQIAVLGCYINPLHPDPARHTNSRWFKEHLRFARDFGCGLVALETGSFHRITLPPGNHGEKAFQESLEALGSWWPRLRNSE